MSLSLQGTVSIATLAICGTLFASNDDVDEVPAAAVVNQQRANFPEENFDQMLFQGYGNAPTVRDRMKGRLKTRLEELDRACSLTPEQKQKLTLAAQGDMKRFFDEVDDIKTRFRAARQDQNAVQELIQECQPIQAKLSAGLFGDKSLFQKTVRHILTEEQTSKYQVVEDDRRRYRYRATIGVVLSNLERANPLKNSQRKALTELLVLETPPPESFGDYDHQYVLYQLAHLPESDVKQHFDARQWKLFEMHLEENRAAEQMLIQQHVLPKKEAKPVRRAPLTEPKDLEKLPGDATRPANQQE